MNAETMTDAPILAADHWLTNADLIADVARLGWLRADQRTLDPTYGRGLWWTKWRPTDLVTHDIALDGVDFRQLPHADGEFRQAVFDPPYISPGGRRHSTMPDFNDRYGLHSTPGTPWELQVLIDAGLHEVARVTDGIVCVKCKDYICSGRYWPGTHHTLAAALTYLELVDRFEHIGRPGPQPKNRTRADGTPSVQVHARRNLSTLLVFWSRGGGR